MANCSVCNNTGEVPHEISFDLMVMCTACEGWSADFSIEEQAND